MNISICTKRITETFYQKLTFINFFFLKPSISLPLHLHSVWELQTYPLSNCNSKQNQENITLKEWMFLLDVVGRFGVFYHNKKLDAEFCQNPVPQKSNFYRRLRLRSFVRIIMIIMNIKPLAVKYIKVFTNYIILF